MIWAEVDSFYPTDGHISNGPPSHIPLAGSLSVALCYVMSCDDTDDARYGSPPLCSIDIAPKLAHLPLSPTNLFPPPISVISASCDNISRRRVTCHVSGGHNSSQTSRNRHRIWRHAELGQLGHTGVTGLAVRRTVRAPWFRACGCRRHLYTSFIPRNEMSFCPYSITISTPPPSCEVWMDCVDVSWGVRWWDEFIAWLPRSRYRRAIMEVCR